MRKSTFAKVCATMAAMAFAVALAACGASSLGMESLEEVSGVRVTAENAGSDHTVESQGAIVVEDGDAIIISPCMDRGGFHLTLTKNDDGTVVFDDDVDGRVLFQIDAAPGTYDVVVSGNGATGWMTVFATNADELGAQNDSLAEALEGAGVDPSILSGD